MLKSVPWILLFALTLGCSESDSPDAACEGSACVDGMMPSPPDSGPTVDEGTEPTPDAGVGRANVSPERFEFTFVEIGGEQQQTVALVNEGTAPLQLQDFAGAFSSDYLLYWQHGRPANPLDEQELGVSNGENSFPDEIEVMPSATVLFTLVYRPTEGGQRGGEFALTGDREMRIAIEHSDERPEFTALPNPVDFGQVEAGDRADAKLTVTNVGTAIATLEEVSITGSEAFEISIEGADPEMFPQALRNPDRDLEPGVGIGKDVDIFIRFRPEDDMPASAEVRIVSDAINGDITVPVTGNQL